MPNYNGDGTSSGVISGTTASGTDWLSSILNPISNAVITVASTKAQVDTLNNQTKTTQSYQDQQQAVGSKNLISGIDNNYLILGIFSAIGVYMFLKG
ncbi:hypothetical protein [Sulfurospirillum sp. 1612]|uniref:hypothetical protein n=1 Tax=Sulfurospirillum sp. 1612 TaxID=3094835 RepID=UPI002F92F4C3